MGTNGILECKCSIEKRAPCSSRNPMTLTLTRQNPWLKRAPYKDWDVCYNTAGGMVARECWLLEREEHRTRIGMSVINIVWNWAAMAM
jgi:hypothetical protein